MKVRNIQYCRTFILSGQFLIKAILTDLKNHVLALVLSIVINLLSLLIAGISSIVYKLSWRLQAFRQKIQNANERIPASFAAHSSLHSSDYEHMLSIRTVLYKSKVTINNSFGSCLSHAVQCYRIEWMYHKY